MYHPALRNLLAENRTHELHHQTQGRKRVTARRGGAVWKRYTARLSAYLERFGGPAPPGAPAF